MTKAEIKRTLNRPETLDMLIRILDAKIERYESMAQGHAIRYDSIRVQNTPEDPVEKVMARLYQLLDKRKKLRDEQLTAVKRTEELVDLVADPKRRLVLGLRYITGLSWYEVSMRTGCTERHVYRLHDAAIDDIFQKIR